MRYDLSNQTTPSLPRIQARPIKKIVDIKTDKTVGWVYEWNNGETATTWFAEGFIDVRYDTVRAA